MPPDVTLRDAGLGDEEFLYRLFAATREHEFAALCLDRAQIDGLLRMQFSARKRDYGLRFPNAVPRLILLGNQPIGALTTDDSGDETILVDIAVLPELQGRGIGAVVIEGMLDAARIAGKKVSLHVQRGSPATRLYQRLGFRETGGDEMYVAMLWTPPPPEGLG